MRAALAARRLAWVAERAWRRPALARVCPGTRNFSVSVPTIERALAAALILTLVGAAAAAPSRRVEPDGFGSELVEKEVKQVYGATLKVWLTDVRTGEADPEAPPVSGRPDRSPHGMGQMSARFDPAPRTLPGHSRFTTDLTMGSVRALTIQAEPPKVFDPSQGRLDPQAVP